MTFLQIEDYFSIDDIPKQIEESVICLSQKPILQLVRLYIVLEFEQEEESEVLLWE